MPTEPSITDAPPSRGAPKSGVRAHNERLVLTLIRQRGPLAKADIARALGLSAQTISVIMRGLEADGLLLRGEPIRGKVGQPSVPMRICETGAYLLGMKVGRRSVEVILTDFLGNVQERKMRVHPYPTPDATLAFAREAIDALLTSLSPDARRRVVGLGIAMPFFLWNWAEKLGVPVQHMTGWREIDLAREMSAWLDFPVYLENDASAACAAEVVFGPPETPSDFLYFYIGYFIGGGIVLNGALFSGAGNAGAIGPLPVPTNGGVEQLLEVASLSGLETRLKAKDVDTSSMWLSPEGWEFDHDIVGSWIDQAAAGMAHAIASACALIDFGDVVIDGWIPRCLCQRVIERVDIHLDRLDTTGMARPKLGIGSVGADARTLGAASLPLRERFLVEAG